MEKVGFGIIGTGRISDWVLKGAVLDPRFEAAAVCSRNPESAARFAESHGIASAYSDLDEMLADPAVRAVYIGTPNHTHRDLALRCLRQGKHVLCEKPLASNAAQAREMAAEARKRGLLLMEAMISTLSPNFRNIQKRMGEIGRVRHYFAAFCQYSSKIGLLRRIVAGEEDAPVPSSFNPDCSGGATQDIGIYTIYPMVTLFGKPDGVKAEVSTMEVPTPEGPKRIDTQASVQFSYPGMSASVLYSKMADSRLRTEISGEKGSISLDQIHISRQAEMIVRGAPTSGRSEGARPEDITAACDPDEYLCEFREFIDLLLSGRTESGNNSLDNSIAVAEIIDSIRAEGGIVFPADLAE
ncbi:MAG: Gfo/Idh/MocA family protein [Candidatus Cryptobacteroides sp.]